VWQTGNPVIVGNSSMSCSLHQSKHRLGSGLQQPWNRAEQPELLKEVVSSLQAAASSEKNNQKKVSPAHDQ
jgi:hypothetical protein